MLWLKCLISVMEPGSVLKLKAPSEEFAKLIDGRQKSCGEAGVDALSPVLARRTRNFF
jgi:hypothetical protein